MLAAEVYDILAVHYLEVSPALEQAPRYDGIKPVVHLAGLHREGVPYRERQFEQTVIALRVKVLQIELMDVRTRRDRSRDVVVVLRVG